MLILFAAAIVPACPRPITLMARSTFQHRRMRMPSKTHVTADYEDGVLVLHFFAYTGNVQIYVYDSSKNLVVYECGYVSDSCIIIANIESGTTQEDYILDVALDNVAYSGQF